MSRSSALFVVLCVCCATLLAQDNQAYSVGARSRLYAMDIDVQPLPTGERQYEIRITDLAMSSVVAQPRVTAAAGTRVATRSEVGDLQFVVRIQPHPESLSVTLEVERDGTIVDSIQAAFTVRPRRAHLNAPGALRVGGDVRAPVVIKRVEPMYTEEARQHRISGIVIVEVLIDETGAVRDAVVAKDLPDGLGQAAIDAVKQWEFQPATRNGAPVPVIFNLTVNFKLQQPVVRQ